MTIIETAIELGLPVFPCHSHNKAPCTLNGFKDASDDPAVIRELWKQRPGPLIGVPTGARSGIDVLDVDPRHGGAAWHAEEKTWLPAFTGPAAAGCISFSRLRRKRGAAPGRSRPASIREPPEATSFGGLQLASRSRTRRWRIGLAGLLERLATAPAVTPSVTCVPRHRTPAGRMQGLIRTITESRTGERNCRLFWAANRAKEMITGGEIAAGLAREIIAAAAEQMNDPLPHGEVSRILGIL